MKYLGETIFFNILLLMTIAGEFFLPWILKYFYKGYDSRTMVMSVLGSPESPVRKIYNIWLVWLGVFLLFVAGVIYYDTRGISVLLAIVAFIVIATFAIGAGLLSGIFSVNESKETVTAASKIHGAGSAIGFMALALFPLFSAITSFIANNRSSGIICTISFVLDIIFFAFFIMGDKPKFEKTVFRYSGLWERLCLFFMYVPFIYRALDKLFFLN